MKFFRAYKFDIKNGLYRNKFILFSFFITIFISIQMYHLIDLSCDRNNVTSCFGDFFVYIYGGMKEYLLDKNAQEPFKFPIIWMIIMLFPALATLNFPFNDIKNFGMHSLYRIHSRKIWWLSKCLWNISVTVFFHLSNIIFICICSIISSSKFSTQFNVYILKDIFNYREIDLFNFVTANLKISLITIITPILISISLNLFQMMLSLFIKPIYSFLFIAAILLISSYSLSTYLIGNFAMIVRSNILIKNGMNFNVGIIISVVLIAFSVVVGSIRFKHFDIYNKG